MDDGLIDNGALSPRQMAAKLRRLAAATAEDDVILWELNPAAALEVARGLELLEDDDAVPVWAIRVRLNDLVAVVVLVLSVFGLWWTQ